MTTLLHEPADTPSDSPAADDCTTLEVARRLGMAVRSVQMMVDRGELEAWKTPGGHRRIARNSVDRWVNQHRTSPGRPEAVPPQAPRLPVAVPGPAPRRILLIEDSRHYQNLIGLQFPNVELHVADDGISGLALAGQLQPEVLLVDILLPGIDGATLINSLRSHPAFGRSRLIVVTSLDEVQRARYALALSGVTVVHKPQIVTQLPIHLHDVLGQSPVTSAAAGT
jgi:excisionase family DNA binding protein